MAISGEVRDQLAARFGVLLPHLNERQQRLALATEARLLGHGGIRAVAEAAGVSQSTVRKGVFELEAGEDPLPVGRARRAGGGRKRVTEHDPELLSALLALVEPLKVGKNRWACPGCHKSLTRWWGWVRGVAGWPHGVEQGGGGGG